MIQPRIVLRVNKGAAQKYLEACVCVSCALCLLSITDTNDTNGGKKDAKL